MALEITIDRVGRVVIPKEIRDEAGLAPGMPLVIRCRNGRIEIEAKPRTVRIEKRGRLQVAVAVGGGEPLTAATVDATKGKLRGETE